jgi:hypothetical protein
MEGRLCARYVALVKEHMRTATSVASGLASLPGEGKAASCAQAMWWFLSNDRVTLPALAEPPREVARQVVNADAYASGYVLLVHDWSKLTFKAHTSKEDKVAVSHSEDVGYELTTSLLVDAERGCPLAPMEMQLWAADGLHTTRQETVADRVNPLAQVLPSMRAAPGGCVRGSCTSSTANRTRWSTGANGTARVTCSCPAPTATAPRCGRDAR